MKILITGANGMLAKEIKEKFAQGNELILTDVAELDITNREAVMKYVEETRAYNKLCCIYSSRQSRRSR